MRFIVAFLTLVCSWQALAAPQLVRLDNERKLAAEELLQKPKILVFWASWCYNCSENMKTLLSMYPAEELKNVAVGVSIDESAAAADSYFKKKPYVLPFRDISVLDTNGEWAGELKLQGIPAVLLVNQGKIVKLWYGHIEAKEQQELRSEYAKLVEKK